MSRPDSIERLNLLNQFILRTCYNVTMTNRTLEADRDGRISIYPSLRGPKEIGFLRRICKGILLRIVKRRN